MNQKVILISIDGMRPDGVISCGHPFVQELMRLGSYTLNAKTVMPSVTLPCHMSMFHSVPPQRHNVVTNTYTPPVHPVNSLFDQLHAAGAACGMFYGWHPLRDIVRPGKLITAEYIHSYAADHTDRLLTDRCLNAISMLDLDFAFLYMVETDEKGGHDNGWMSDTYLQVLGDAIDNVKRVIETVGDRYTVIVTADHGGHDRAHGTEMPEDMTIPMFFCGKDFTPGAELQDVSILDLTPTIADLMHVAPAREWEGKSLLKGTAR